METLAEELAATGHKIAEECRKSDTCDAPFASTNAVFAPTFAPTHGDAVPIPQSGLSVEQLYHDRKHDDEETPELTPSSQSATTSLTSPAPAQQLNSQDLALPSAQAIFAPGVPLTACRYIERDVASQTPASIVHSAASPLGDSSPVNGNIEYDYDGPPGHGILRLKPTMSQWEDFPTILTFARSLGTVHDGCFKVVLPSDFQEELPKKSSHTAAAHAYRIKYINRTNFWRVSTVRSEGVFTSSEPEPDYTTSVDDEIKKLKTLFRKSKDKQMRKVRYRVDVPAWTVKQRLVAGVPKRSPIHPLRGDKLDYTKAVIPGIHTPYVYESGPDFGATFQIHAEDYRLASLNHLYKGRKIWIVIPATAVDVAEKALGRGKKCSQFMRHRAEFFFPEKLKKLGVPYRLVDQRPGETIVILPDAYHEGFSTGYTIAEAKNYAEPDWTTDTYQPCEAKCHLETAIPGDFMRPVRDGEERLDLCAAYDVVVPPLLSLPGEGQQTYAVDTKQAVPLPNTPKLLKRPHESDAWNAADERNTKEMKAF